MQLADIIREAIPEATVEILDPMMDGVHLEARVVSSGFKGKTRVEQHRMVMRPLKEHFNSNALHALTIKTFEGP